jgi:hypothetical protein
VAHLLLGTAILCAPSVLAQPPRAPVFGEARRADGSPWAGAEVMLLSRPVPWIDSTGTFDEVRVRADSQGAFRAEVLPARGSGSSAMPSRTSQRNWTAPTS